MANKTGQSTDTQIMIPIRQLLPANEFRVGRTDRALRACQNQGYEPLFMPQIIDARIEAPNEARLWQHWYTAPSIMATGKTKQGSAVVVYAHVPNYFSNPDNIETAIKQGLVNHAGIMPQDEFQTLLDLEDNENVFVADYGALNNSSSGTISLKDALKHPQTVPFLGGQERAEKYLKRHKEVYGNKIVILHCDKHYDDSAEQPLGRLLVLGGSCDPGLYGYSHIDNDAAVLGVRNSSASQKTSTPSLNELLELTKNYVPAVASREFKKNLSRLYK